MEPNESDRSCRHFFDRWKMAVPSAWRVLCLFQLVSLLTVQDVHGHLQSYDDSQHFSILWTENEMSKEVSVG